LREPVVYSRDDAVKGDERACGAGDGLLQVGWDGGAFEGVVEFGADLVDGDPDVEQLGLRVAKELRIRTFGCASVAGAENLARAGQAACSYSWRLPPRRSRRRM
jgi:hypothetical protein